ncbi:leucyl aminopeptidase [Porticoccus sp. W117]|uniref:leucyl aminopeptidase n=1 Tax=Porticoccus sp. W117 TaxID=3054777 RepID=UPI002596AEB1|nr:leucyl aminopeptidase [Porticoccus sp. W117]MDM3869954.1 leucyl aminopeptidase [Porticoccus sp. W117]
MEFSLRTADATTAKTACLVIVAAEGKLTGVANAVDKATNGTLTALVKSGDFSGKKGEQLLLPVTNGLGAQRVLLVGAGKDALNDQGFIKLVKAAAKKLVALKVKDALLCVEDLDVTGRDMAWRAQQAARLCGEAVYQFTKFKSKKPPKVALKKVTLQSSKGSATIKNALANGRAIASGVNLARELGDLPGNACDPSYMATRGRAFAKNNPKVTTKVLDEKQMKALGMNSLLSVSAGSDNPGKTVIVEYKGGKKTDKPVVLIGKGVTFDSGGISLKPGQSMDEMKYDMGGSATVYGTMQTVIEMGLPINLVAIVGCVENMPSGKATKPGDIVTSMSGLTIEVLNTDAEGRLVLCDCMTYAERYKPQAVIDVATLTGAIIIGLGHHPTAIYSNNDELSEQLVAAGNESADRGWPMPLWDEYGEELKSPFADLQNIGAGRAGGSITAAAFLAKFATKYNWAHLDIAGTFWNSGANKGATGRPVPMLVEYLSKVAK